MRKPGRRPPRPAASGATATDPRHRPAVPDSGTRHATPGAPLRARAAHLVGAAPGRAPRQVWVKDGKGGGAAMSEPGTRSGVWRELLVGAVFWDRAGSPYPEVMVSWDPDELDRRLAGAIHRAVLTSPDWPEARQWAAGRPGPDQWAAPGDADRWLEDLNSRPWGPVFHREAAAIDLPAAADGAGPGYLRVAVVRWGEVGDGDFDVVAGADPDEVERELAAVILNAMNRGWNPAGSARFIAEHGFPDLGDPSATHQWLTAAGQTIDGVAFTTHHHTLPAPPEAGRAGERVSVAAVFWDGTGPGTPELWADRDNDRLERRVAETLHAVLEERAVTSEPLDRFLGEAGGPSRWETPADVSKWLDAAETGQTQIGFAIDTIQVGPLPDTGTVQAAAVWDTPDGEPRLLAAATPAGLRAQLGETLTEGLLSSAAPGAKGRGFLARHGQAPLDQTALTGWLDAYAREVGVPKFTTARTALAPGETPAGDRGQGRAGAGRPQDAPPPLPAILERLDRLERFADQIARALPPGPPTGLRTRQLPAERTTSAP
ncbi:MAG: hypothetical protein LBU05_03445, partial [Bifidobacteriaceae bacterium]|nr:hypothetical protein [Bifidobacteriaceae bacterium]